MLIDFEPAALCPLQSDLVLAPLPAKKELWEAGNEFVWNLETDRERAMETSFGLAANGELVKLDEGQSFCSGNMLRYTPSHTQKSLGSNSHWEEWCSGMDGLGGLVMLAAALVV
jgi:hypothetical protein